MKLLGVLVGAGALLVVTTAHAADPVVAWSRNLANDLPGRAGLVTLQATALTDGTVLLTDDRFGGRRVHPGGRVQTFAGTPFVDAEERLFVQGFDSFERIDPETGLPLFTARGTLLGLGTRELVVTLPLHGLSARDGRVVWGPVRFGDVERLDAVAQSGAVGFISWRHTDAGVLRRRITAVQLDEGRVLWTRVFPRSIDRFLACGREGDLFVTETGGRGKLIRIDTSTGEDLWSVPLPADPGGSYQNVLQLFVDGVGKLNVRLPGRIVKVDPGSGAVLSQLVLGPGAGPVQSSVAGHLLVPVQRESGLSLEKIDVVSGRLLARSKFTGAGETFLASTPAPDGTLLLHSLVASPPSVGVVVSRRLDGALSVLSEERTPLTSPGYVSPPPDPQLAMTPRGVLVGGYGFAVFDPEDGHALVSRFVAGSRAPGLVTPEGDVVSHELPGPAIVKRDGSTGEVLWRSSAGPYETAMVLAPNGDVLTLEPQGSTNTRRLRRRGGGDGRSLVRSSIPIPGFTNFAPRLFSGSLGLYAATVSTDPYRVDLHLVNDEDGTIVWSKKLEPPELPQGFVVANGDLVARMGDRVERLNPGTGEPLWTVKVSPESSIVARGTDVLVMNPASFLRLDGADGRIRASRPLPEDVWCAGWRLTVAGDGNLWAACPAKLFVALLDSDSGVTRGSIQNLFQSDAGIVAGERDAFVLRGTSLARLTERAGLAPVPFRTYVCGEAVDLVLAFGPPGSTLRVVEGALPSGLTLSEISGRLSGTLASDGIHRAGFRVIGPDGLPSSPVQNVTFLVAPAKGSELTIDASPVPLKPGESTRLSIAGLPADAAASVTWLPGGERSREIVVRPSVTTKYTALVSAPGSCPRRGSVMVQVAVPEPVTPGSGFHTVVPCRLLDSRTDLSEPFTDGIVQRVDVARRCGIPDGAVALAVNLTSVDATRAGMLEVVGLEQLPHPGTGVPSTPGRVRSTSLIVPLDGEGVFGLRADLPLGGSTHAIVDVSGYFR